MSERVAVVIGASAGVGRALSQHLARAGYALVLVAKDARDLSALASDLALRFDARCTYLAANLADRELDVAKFVQECVTFAGRVSTVFYVAGFVSGEDERGLAGDQAIQATITVNYTNAVRILGAFASLFGELGAGRIVGFSSIAAAAPRGRNMVYASAKAGLEAYLRALRHHFAGRGVTVQCYALGYVDTAMTFGKRLLFPKVSPESVADAVLRDLDKDPGLVYFPAFWGWVTWILRRLPWFVYRRLSF